MHETTPQLHGSCDGAVAPFESSRDGSFHIGFIHATFARRDVTAEGISIVLTHFSMEEFLEMVNDPITGFLVTSGLGHR
ncbi:hypothetical protein P6U21_30540, partial [Bacillus paranthracis]|nr:hypothetical protein [Bacillus paranthracis]